MGEQRIDDEPFTLLRERAIIRRNRFRPEANLHDRSRQMQLFTDVNGNSNQGLLFGEALPICPRREG